MIMPYWVKSGSFWNGRAFGADDGSASMPSAWMISTTHLNPDRGGGIGVKLVAARDYIGRQDWTLFSGRIEYIQHRA
jgi:hypothetical protein